jgi:PAS domain S-box-containing protein
VSNHRVGGNTLTISARDATLVQGAGPRSDEAFQNLLLRFSSALAHGTPSSSLIQLFCQTSRQFFGVDGAYFWRVDSDEELVGTEADGVMADRFRGIRLTASQSAVAVEAIRQRKTIRVNRLDAGRYPMAAEFRARSIMAAPLVVLNEAIGAAVFLHCSDADYFTDDLAAKATILAGQLGSLLEASRLSQASREEHRRAEILAEVAHALRAGPDPGPVIDAIADRLRVLLRTRLVCVLLRQGNSFCLRAVAAESSQLADSVRARHDRKGLHFSAELASRAIAAGEPIRVAIDPPTHSLGELIPAGELIAAPFRTSISQGAILVYPREEGAFTPEEMPLISAITGFGAVAIANAELCGTARAQTHELHQLLDISSELGSIGQLDNFLQQFALRAADFLGFGRAFIGLLEGGLFHVRWGTENGKPKLLEMVFPQGPASRKLLAKEVFWSDHPSKTPGANLDVLAKFNVRQLLTVPLLDTAGQVLGMFGVLDRLDQAAISPEDIRRARALSAQVAVALEVKRNLHLSEQHRRRAESLMALALELNSHLQLAEFARKFVSRAAEMMGARVAGLSVKQGNGLDTLVLQNQSGEIAEGESLRRFSHAVDRALLNHAENIISSAAGELFDSSLSSLVDNSDCTLVRLLGTSGELVGVLCLANCGKVLAEYDQQLLQAIASHASVALENALLFTRMEQANRHWIEIFDAISDFIVAHDEEGNVLRVNRSLADFIGVKPQELIGVNISALLAINDAAPARSCPFCRSMGEDADEYVHPVLERSYLVSTSRVHGANGEGMQTIHVLKDISDRREAERRYRELFDNIQEGLFFATPDGRFVEVNDALVRMLGYNGREQLLQGDIREQVYSSSARYQQFAASMQAHGIVRNYEESLRRQDGTTVYVLINAFAVRDSQDRIVQYRGLMLDISGLKAFQAELQRERDFSGKILNNTQSLIVVTDGGGRISYANRRWRDLGYEQRYLLGRPLHELVAANHRQNFDEALKATAAGRQVDNLDLQLLLGQGRVGQFSANLNPMRDEQGNVSSLVVVMTDVTDAATMQAKLMHAEKLAAVGQLVSGVAHEVNNPLTAILGFADLLMDNPELTDSARKDLRVILQEAQRTKQIVQNLLSFARQMPPQRKPVQLNTILRRTVQLRAYDFQSHGVQVIERLAQQLPNVMGDAQQLQQVFLNILNNAYDAVRETERPSRIEITTAPLGSSVEISFSDNGSGISHPERIFDPFFTTKEVGKGTGLGLSICYGILREHGGEILCHNNPNGEGATFIVRLPVAPQSRPTLVDPGVLQP